MQYITRADEILLLAILHLKGNAYGVTIIKEVEKRSGKVTDGASLLDDMFVLKDPSALTGIKSCIKLRTLRFTSSTTEPVQGWRIMLVFRPCGVLLAILL